MKRSLLRWYISLCWRSRLRVTACLPIAAFLIQASASAQGLTAGPSLRTKREIHYAETLNRMGLPDYARTVLNQIKDPAAKPMIKVLRMAALASKGSFEEVRKIIAREPDQSSQEVWAMKLTLADNYYAWGKYPEARSIYESLFKTYPSGPPEALNDFYVESSYKYARMLILLGKHKEGALAYDNITKAKISKLIRRQVITEKAELLVKVAEEAEPDERERYFKQINDICDEILEHLLCYIGILLDRFTRISRLQFGTRNLLTSLSQFTSKTLQPFAKICRGKAIIRLRPGPSNASMVT